jgi:hypothetical protein
VPQQTTSALLLPDSRMPSTLSNSGAPISPGTSMIFRPRILAAPRWLACGAGSTVSQSENSDVPSTNLLPLASGLFAWCNQVGGPKRNARSGVSDE